MKLGGNDGRGFGIHVSLTPAAVPFPARSVQGQLHAHLGFLGRPAPPRWTLRFACCPNLKGLEVPRQCGPKLGTHEDLFSEQRR